jgi:anti-sigma regulatory factor (Ser/Thr protein kinase)
VRSEMTRLLLEGENPMNGRASTVPAVVRPGSAPAEHRSGAGPALHAEESSEAWPLRSYLELGALPSAVPCFRLHVKHVLWEWGLEEELAATVELVVSELVTNGQRASAQITSSRYKGVWRPGVPPVRLWLHSDKERVLVQVWDADDRMPEPQVVDPEAESGRGLLLVATLSTEWGTYRPEGASGKCVWAMLAAATGRE